MREQLAADTARHRESLEATTCRLRAEESQKCSLEERLEKTHDELQKMKAEHCNVSSTVAFDALQVKILSNYFNS